MNLVSAFATFCLAMALGACSSGPGRGQDGTLAGVFGGRALGSVAAQALDGSDRRRVARALESASDDGQPSAWRNRDTGDSFVVTPGRSFEQGGTRCRDFTVDAVVGGRNDRVGGSACRQSDGNWHIRE